MRLVKCTNCHCVSIAMTFKDAARDIKENNKKIDRPSKRGSKPYKKLAIQDYVCCDKMTFVNAKQGDWENGCHLGTVIDWNL